MTPRFAFPDVLPNPCGARVFTAEAALSDVNIALSGSGHDGITSALLRAAQALREAGWQPAVRFVNTLLLASPFMAGDATPTPSADAASMRVRFTGALQEFRAALARGNLRELACSPVLFARQRALCDALAPYAPGFSLTFADVALAGRIVLPAMLPTPSTATLAALRARYEAALLPVLRMPIRAEQNKDIGAGQADIQMDAACDELNACLAELASAHPYDFWRLAAACARACHNVQDDALRHRFYAHCNLALIEHTQGQRLAPQSLVRETLALLWRAVALSDAAAQDAESVEVLHDYGLTVQSRAMDEELSGTLRLRETGKTDAPQTGSATRCEPGVLSVDADAHKNFLRIADTAMATLLGVQHVQAQSGIRMDDACRAAEAAYRLGASALTLGLGHVALLAESLGLAWRLTAHVQTASNAAAHSASGTLRGGAPDAVALKQAGTSLQTMLLKVAAGVAQPDAAGALAALGEALGRVSGQFAAY